jgi:hypothetical protein
VDWISIGSAAIGGGLGGLFGALLSRALRDGTIGRIVMIVLIIGGGRLGAVFLAPAIHLEIALQDPKNPMSLLLKESGVPPLQARWELLQAYVSGGSDALQKKAAELGAKGMTALTDRIAYASDDQVDRFYKAMRIILLKAQMTNPSVCANWASGAEPIVIRDTGATKEEIEEFEAAISSILAVELPPPERRKNLIVDVVVAAKLQGAVGVRSQDEGLDLDVLSGEVKSMTPQQKKVYCDTIMAFYDEIGKLPKAERITFLRAMLSQR